MESEPEGDDEDGRRDPAIAVEEEGVMAVTEDEGLEQEDEIGA